MKRLILLALLLPAVLGAEVKFNSVSVTDVSKTIIFTTQRAGVLLCNYGANEVFYRVFDEFDTQGAATASNAQLPAGTATAPVCKAFSKTPTEPGFFIAVSLIASGGETATVQIESN